MKHLHMLIVVATACLVIACSKREALGPVRGDTNASGGNSNPNNEERMTAGEWNDLTHWDFWMSLRDSAVFESFPAYWGMFGNTRVAVEVLSAPETPLQNAPIALVGADGNILWETKTDNAGKAELWSGFFENTTLNLNGCTLTMGGQILTSTVKPISEGINTFVINGVNPSSPKMDIAFVVDATGSMGDELEFLKKELSRVIDRVKAQHPDADLRLGSVFYRDKGDEYVTRKQAFSSSPATVVSFIKDQSADGGGDFPEAVEDALQVTVNELQWSADATSRIAFLILDAPPHDKPEVKEQIRNLTKAAAQKGIKIIPITASGIDKSTEYLMRMMAIASNGTYVFITDHSGIGNDHLEATVGEYQVEFLDDLMVRLIGKYLE